MIFVDSNVFIYAVGRDHPLKNPARQFFHDAIEIPSTVLVTSSEVLQELLHVYLPVNRVSTLDAALQLARGVCADIWPLEPDDVQTARELMEIHPGLGARDLVHLACCHRRAVTRIQTYDRGLAAAFPS